MQCEIPDGRDERIIGQAAIGLLSTFLREAEHLRPFVDEQLAQSECGAGSQRRREDVLCLVGVVGCSHAERKLDRGV